jgi:heat shock protein HslJ
MKPWSHINIPRSHRFFPCTRSIKIGRNRSRGVQVRRKCREDCVTISRSVFKVVLSGLAALTVGTAAPSDVSAASCRLNDPAALRNITYKGILGDAAALRDGVYEGDPFLPGGASRPRVELLGMPPVLHDLDGDGIDDAAVLLAESSGGNGVFTWLAVVSCRDGQAVNVGTTVVGDRVMIRSVVGREGAIVVDFVGAGPREPLCCPTRNVRNRYRLRDGNLLLASSEVRGTVSLADVRGVAWRLSRLGRNERVPEGVKVTAVFGDGKVSGSGGCNRYSATVVETAPREFSVGPAASTKMACPEPAGGFEDRFFSALQAANRFGFLLGDLVLDYGRGDARETMIFEREVHR